MTAMAYDLNLTEWSQEVRDLHDVAESLIRTSFVPMTFKKTRKDGKDVWRDKDIVVSETVAAILAGREVGLHPMAALRSIQIIGSTPAMTALAMRGLVQSRGHEIWPTEQTESKVTVKGRRRGSDKDLTSTWTIDRARKMGLADKAQWRAQPMAMLVARATAECCRLTASDVLLGLPYAVEELQDEAPLEGADVEPAQPRKAKRRSLEPVATADPDLPEQAEPEQPTEPTQPVEPTEPTPDPWPEVAPIPADGEA